MSDAARPHRGTIHLEDGVVISQVEWPGEQYILRVHAPECAARAVPGSFAHIRCADDMPMRRPLSIMRADAASGEIEFLYKIVGPGLRALSQARAGDALSVLGPIGNGFSPREDRPRKLMLGGGVGIPPMVFLAEHLKSVGDDDMLVLMGSEVPFPFELTVGSDPDAKLPSEASSGILELEQQGIKTRLASVQGFSGAYNGYITDLARHWLNAQGDDLQLVEIFACGPEPMLEAAAAVAAEFGLPCQLSLEEFMACAVGGCAGCTVPVYLPGGQAMKRVCVDGPVFEAAVIYPAA